MWSTEVHECQLEQALQDNVAVQRAKRYGTQPPRIDAASIDAIGIFGANSVEQSWEAELPSSLDELLLAAMKHMQLFLPGRGACWPIMHE